MKTVYKFELDLVLQFYSLNLPTGWKFLKVGFQNNRLYLWAEVVESAQKDVTHFAAYGTGQEIPNHATYLTTYELGPYVFHLYII